MSNDYNVSNAEWDEADLDAPLEDAAVGWLQRQPVVALALTLLVPALAAVVEALASGAEVRAVVIAGASALVTAGLALVRRVVTPVAAPRLDEETPLVVPGPDEVV